MATFIIIFLGAAFIAHFIMYPAAYAHFLGDILKFVVIVAVVVSVTLVAMKFIGPEIIIPVMSIIIYFGILLDKKEVCHG